VAWATQRQNGSDLFGGLSLIGKLAAGVFGHIILEICSNNEIHTGSLFTFIIHVGKFGAFVTQSSLFPPVTIA